MTRPAAWLPDPLDDSLVRFWDGQRWTFHTAVKPVEAPRSPAQPLPEPKPQQALRPDVAAALDKVRGMLLGSMKEVNLLGDYLEPEERVLTLCGAHGEGRGVLACTNHRLIFLFVGLIRKQVLQVRWNDVKHVHYTASTRLFAVYNRRPTRRVAPIFWVNVDSIEDAKAIADAAGEAAAAPRLDVV
ncbi:DUF2510 domain-containing protein [Kibdelosporangium aridum]|uniref:DUF2510 domain-containing protein n=1 Tax=Kibdelosporangium aridum TaxID=2030 RepID=UPI0005253D6F